MRIFIGIVGGSLWYFSGITNSKNLSVSVILALLGSGLIGYLAIRED